MGSTRITPPDAAGVTGAEEPATAVVPTAVVPTDMGEDAQATSPVEFVPGPQEAGTTGTTGTAGPQEAGTTATEDNGATAVGTPSAPVRPRGARLPRRPGALAGPALVVVALAFLQAGLAVHAAGRSLWSQVPLWAAFATLACVLGIAAYAERLPVARRLLAGRGWSVAAGGVTGLAAFWLLVALPTADTDRGFLLTAALACSGAAAWRAAGRPRTRAGAEPRR